MNRDPIQEDGGFNLYQFVHSNPLTFVDPFGLQLDSVSRNAPLALQLEAEELGITVAQLLVRKAAQAAAKKASEEAAKALIKRCTKNPGKLAKQLNKTKKQIEEAIHVAKRKLQRFKGKGEKGNVDVTIDPTDGQVYPEIPGGGLGDAIDNIFDILEELGQ